MLQEATGLRVTRDGILRYKRSGEYRFFITAPEEHRLILVLARALLCFRGEANFSGGFLWLRRWIIGSPPGVFSGWLILESIRRAHGELRSLEVADAQYFRDDELVEAHVFLIQTIAYGWVADFVPLPDVFSFTSKTIGRSVSRPNPRIHWKELRTAFQRWNPTDEDPMVIKMRSMERMRKRAGQKPK